MAFNFQLGVDQHTIDRDPQHDSESNLNFEDVDHLFGDARQLVSDARELRRKYEETKSRHLLRLKQALADVQQADLQLFYVDMHIGKLQHLICKSGLQEIPPVVANRSGRGRIVGILD